MRFTHLNIYIRLESAASRNSSNSTDHFNEDANELTEDQDTRDSNAELDSDNPDMVQL